MAFSGMYASIYSRAGHLQILGHHPPDTVFRIINRLRRQIGTHLDHSVSGEPRQILAALLLGDRSGISPELRDAFNRSGVGHVLAISGLHIGIIATVFFFLFTFLLSRFSALLWNARVKKIAALAAILPVLFYGILSGMSPSTQRAVIMVTIFLLAFPLEREQDLINTIAVAALLILIFFPPGLFSISFQLSFTAVLAIVTGMSAIAPEAPGASAPWWKKGRNRLVLFFLVSVLAAGGNHADCSVSFSPDLADRPDRQYGSDSGDRLCGSAGRVPVPGASAAESVFIRCRTEALCAVPCLEHRSDPPAGSAPVCRRQNGHTQSFLKSCVSMPSLAASFT